MRAAQHLGVPMWELLERPDHEFWIDLAWAALVAEAAAAGDHAERARRGG